MAYVITGGKTMTTYAIKAFGPYPFPYFRDNIKSSRALSSVRESLLSLGYSGFEAFQDTKLQDGTIIRKLID